MPAMNKDQCCFNIECGKMYKYKLSTNRINITRPRTKASLFGETNTRRKSIDVKRINRRQQLSLPTVDVNNI